MLSFFSKQQVYSPPLSEFGLHSDSRLVKPNDALMQTTRTCNTFGNCHFKMYSYTREDFLPVLRQRWGTALSGHPEACCQSSQWHLAKAGGQAAWYCNSDWMLTAYAWTWYLGKLLLLLDTAYFSCPGYNLERLAISLVGFFNRLST